MTRPSSLPEALSVLVTSEQAQALEAAARRARERPLLTYYDDGVQLQTLHEVAATAGDALENLVAALRLALSRRPYAAVVRGLAFDAEHRLLVAIHRSLGTLVAHGYAPPRQHLVHRVSDTTDLRNRGADQAELLHTDGADWEVPPHIVGMECVAADAGGGGRSRFVDTDTLTEQVDADDLIRLGESSVPWSPIPGHGDRLTVAPVLGDGKIRWRRYTIRAGVDRGYVLDPQTEALLDRFEATVTAADGVHDLLMAPGDLLLLDNRRTLHVRTALRGPPGHRLMHRTWVMTDPVRCASRIRYFL